MIPGRALLLFPTPDPRHWHGLPNSLDRALLLFPIPDSRHEHMFPMLPMLPALALQFLQQAPPLLKGIDPS